MEAYLWAAVPWIAVAYVVLMLLVAGGKKKQNRKDEAADSTEEHEEAETYMNEGMAIGMCIGAASGSIIRIDIGTRISLGMCLGLAIGSHIKKRK